MNDPKSGLDPVAVLAGEFTERYRRGERPALSEYTARYPELAEQIRELFPALVVMEELGSVVGPPIGPAPGAAVRKSEVPEHLGDYRILRELRRGGMGIVFEAMQESLGRHVALKVLPIHGLMSSTHLERFRRESRAAARLHHTNIVPVHGVGEHEGFHYYAMQFIQGQGLDEVLKEVKRLRCNKDRSSRHQSERDADPSQVLAQGLFTGQFTGVEVANRIPAAPVELQTEGSERATPSPPVSSDAASTLGSACSASGTELTTQPEAQYFRSVAQMGMRIAEALDYAHKQGILHRDIKPSNLLLDVRGIVWITDFGLAKADDSDALTHTGDVVGTLRYMAPERFTGWSDPRSDVYGLGITLYELVTLRPAFEDSNRPRLIGRVTNDEPPRPRKVDRLIPPDLETIVLKAIANEPGRRYQTALGLAEDLERFLAGKPVRARRIGIWERGVKWVKRRPAVAALLTVSVAAALFLTAGTLVHNAQLQAALEIAQDNLEKARRAEEQAHLAEQEKTRQLAIAHLRDGQARRNSGLLGRRFESLEALKKAVELFRTLGQLDEQCLLELRNEAIACLVLADLKPAKVWASDPGWSQPFAFDPTLQYYVVRAAWVDDSEKAKVRPGELSIRRLADDQEVARLPGFGVRAVSARFSPNGRYVAVHYEQGQHHDYVWDLSRRPALLTVLQAGGDSFPSFSPDSRLIAFARPDQSIRVYELPSGATRKDLAPSLLASNGHPTSVHFNSDGRRLAVISGTIVQLRDLSDGKVLATFKHPAAVRALAWRSDGKVFATGCLDNDIYLWDVASAAQPLRVLKGHAGAVVRLAFNRGGDLLLSDSWDSTERLWDPTTGQQLVSKRGGEFPEHLFGPDDQRLDYGWQVATGRECRTFHGHKQLAGVAISPKGRLMASVCADGVQLWDLWATQEGEKLLAFLPVGSSMAVQFDPKGESLITDSKSVGLQHWPIVQDSETGGVRIGPPQSLGLSARAPFFGEDPEFTLSADGRTVAHSPDSGHLLVYELDNSARKLLVESSYLRAPSFSPDGRWLATGNWHGQGVKVWDTKTGKLAHNFDLGELEDGTAWPAFSPDGKCLVTGTFAEYGFWKVGSWQKEHSPPRENAGKRIGRIVFSPDSKIVALLHDMTEVRLVDPGPATGHQGRSREFARLPAAGTPYCFSPDGTKLVTHSGRDRDFQVWDLGLIRRQLAELGLDWDLPPYPTPSSESAIPLRVKVLAAERPGPSSQLDAQAFRERGRLYLQLRSYRRAASDFNRAHTLDPHRTLWEEVIRDFTQAIERNPQDADAYLQRANIHERLSQWPNAIADYCQGIKLRPDNWEARVCRGKAYLSIGERDKAAADFRKVAAKPNEANSVAWELVTSADPLHREPSLAVELARQATRQTPGETMYWNTLGVAQYRLGKWEAAIQALEEAEKLAPGKYFSFNAFFLAMCRHQLGDTAKAKDYYGRAVRWGQENGSRLSDAERKQLQAFGAEAEALLRMPHSVP